MGWAKIRGGWGAPERNNGARGLEWRRAPPLACLGCLLWQSKGAMMPAERVAMRHVREIIRLKFSAGISTREIARRLGIAASTVRETLSVSRAPGWVGPCRTA